MISPARAAVLSGIAGGLILACSAFDAEDDASSTPPQGTDAAAADGGAVDGAMNDAAASDAAAPDAALPARGCSVPHTFCDDFDKGTLGATWTAQSFGADGNLTLDTSNVRSAPNALLATLGTFSTDGGAPVDQYIEKTFEAFSSFSCTWQMLVEQHPNVGEPDYIEMNVKSARAGLDETFIEVYGNATGTHLSLFQDPAGSSKFATSGALPLNTWLDASLSIEALGAVKVVIGTRTLVATLDMPPTPNASSGLRLGLHFAGESDGARVRYDDFACDAVP
jgi:hypothetical protein